MKLGDFPYNFTRNQMKQFFIKIDNHGHVILE